MSQQLPVALQLYTVRDHTKNDMDGTLRQVAAMGYAGVELVGYGNLDRQQLKEVIDETSLQVVAAHADLPRLQNELEDIVAEAPEGDWVNNEGGQGTVVVRPFEDEEEERIECDITYGDEEYDNGEGDDFVDEDDPDDDPDDPDDDPPPSAPSAFAREASK